MAQYQLSLSYALAIAGSVSCAASWRWPAENNGLLASWRWRWRPAISCRNAKTASSARGASALAAQRWRCISAESWRWLADEMRKAKRRENVMAKAIQQKAYGHQYGENENNAQWRMKYQYNESENMAKGGNGES